MAENSKIEWCDHTFNPWRGCTKVSPGCAHCYAETLSHRNPAVLGEWGPGRPRVKAAPGMWKQPLRWNKAASEGRWVQCDACGKREARKFEEPYGMDGCSNPECPGGAVNSTVTDVRPRVFCASLADWLDHEAPIQWLADLLALIHATPNLDWLLLTKRPQNWRDRIENASWSMPIGDAFDAMRNWINGTPPANVWIGTTIEDQTRADERIPELLKIPARVRFLSCEPLLGAVDLREPVQIGRRRVMEGILPTHVAGDVSTTFKGLDGIHWVIAGGESGPHARPMHPDWVRGLRDQCAAAGVPFLFKQWGGRAPGGPVLSKDKTRKADPSGHIFGADSMTKMGTIRLSCVGKAKAGRTLDGRIHHEFPKP